MNIPLIPFTTAQKLRQLKEFTDIYRSFSGSQCGAREAACMAYQYAHILLPPEPGDIQAGRLELLPIGFRPQPAPRYGSGVGYYCDTQAIEEWREGNELNTDEKAIAADLAAFWAGNTCKALIERGYTPDQRRYLTQGDFKKLPGVAFPLYRIGGAQLDFKKLVTLGLTGLMDECGRNRARNPDFFTAAEQEMAMMADICRAYGEVCETLASRSSGEEAAGEYLAMGRSVGNLAKGPPENFREALQLVHLYTLISSSFNYGRMDEYLTSFYFRDLNAGILSREEAKRLLKGLWNQMLVRGLTMDARVILGGLGRDAKAGADEFALVVMEVSEEVKETLPQLTLRCFKGMDPRLWPRAMDMLEKGCTYPILYNDDVNVPAVMNAFQVDRETAQSYLPFGCGEYVLYHRSLGTPSGAVNLLALLDKCVDRGFREDSYPFQKAGVPALAYYKTFDEFYRYFLEELEFVVEILALQQKQEYDVCGGRAVYGMYSLLFDDCVSRAKPLLSGGVRYLGGTLETYGNTNTTDSLYAIKKLVYDEKTAAPETMIRALEENFRGFEDLHRLCLDLPKFGNDNAEVDALAVDFHEKLCGMVRSQAPRVGLDSYLVVVINNRMNTLFGLNTPASADGRLANTYMANANNPTGGMDKNGLTAMLNSLLKLRPHLHAGSVQNMRFSREMFGGLRPKTEAVLKGYFDGGGAQAMITVLGRQDLEKAMKTPGAYKNLIVRVGGFSAKFVELAPPVQQELLSRTLY
jgi:pyruvate-formate lyase